MPKVRRPLRLERRLERRPVQSLVRLPVRLLRLVQNLPLARPLRLVQNRKRNDPSDNE